MPNKRDQWEELGERVARARNAARLNQQELASKIGIDRTALTKVESGKRGIDALELARMATILGRPIEWFVSRPSKAAAGRRDVRRKEVMDESPADIALEGLARDVDLLQELGVLATQKPFTPGKKAKSAKDAEAVARAFRKHAGVADGPVWDLQRVAESVGLYAFSVDLGNDNLDGSYLASSVQGGVALINGGTPSGRRRFTMAHELGHHVFQDPYSSEWIVDLSARSRERLINAFAIHFLLPGLATKKRWKQLGGDEEPRSAAIILAAEFGLSWTAVCSHLCSLGHFTQRVQRQLELDPPRRHDYLELGISVRDDLNPPSVPPAYAQAVLKAYKSHKITRARAFEMLRDTIEEHDLPEQGIPRLEALRAEIDPGSEK